MPDVLTPAQRHRCMSHIHSKATKPEITVRKWLWAHGYRYRYSDAQIQNGDFRQRLFLART